MERAAVKRVAFYTLGCKVNQYDTEAMQQRFIDSGYEIVDFDGEVDADAYIINTCTVTNLGDKKSRQIIRRASRRNPNAVIAVVGCYAQRAPDEVLSIPGVSVVLGTRDRGRIVELVEKARETNGFVNGVEDIMRVREFEETPIQSHEGKTRAVLKIQEGCNRFCSYCIIPYTRGPIRSRNPKAVYNEVVRLADAGFKEIVLTGIHIASYGKDLGDISLMELIQSIHPVEGIRRIRLGSLEPALLTTDFIKEIKVLEKVCRHYHISLQSGSDETLKRMNRRYNTDEYRFIVNNLRHHMPDVAITTDIMVGFPGETEQEFKETLAFVEEIAFSRIHVFPYSPRKGTPAAEYPDQIPSGVKEERSRILIELGRRLEHNYINSFIGSETEVLFENKSHQLAGFYEGYTEHYIKVASEGGEELEGNIYKVKLVGIAGEEAIGKVVKQ